MKIKEYAVKTRNTEEEVILINVLNEIDGACMTSVSKSITSYSYVRFKATKKAWKEIKSKLGLHVATIFASFNEED